MRGGLRVGQGRKPRALLDKLPDNPGKRPLKVMDLPEGVGLTGEDMPEPKAYMKEKQRNGGKLEAEEIYRETWLWVFEPLLPTSLWRWDMQRIFTEKH